MEREGITVKDLDPFPTKVITKSAIDSGEVGLGPESKETKQ